MNIGQICHRPAVSIAASASLAEVADLMREHQVGAIVVTQAPLDRAVVVGIVTDRDIVRAQLERAADLSSLRVEDVMTCNPLELNENESLSNAIQRLRAHGVRRAPVVTEHGAIAGLVSTDDLIGQVALELVGLASLISKQHAVT